MDFELIKPNVPFQSLSRRDSEDSSIGRPGSVDRTDQLRPESPAFSIASSASRLTTGLPSDSAAIRARATSKASDTEASMESHRQRELKWVSVMSSVPPSQSRKTKKVRKLIGEGVPASVRYLVWSHLTDCKAKNVPGVYASFGKRARVAAFKDIEGDVRRCFAEHPHLQSTQGPVMALLQAYLTMVPDVPYTTGLTLIAGHLLLLAPEEDAFWIFVTIMDSNLRPYFASSSTQMEVDAALFSRALEANDPPLAKKLLMDMSMNPTHICGPWFTTLFVGSLPTDYINRVWDFFLYEGVPFLIRVGLAIVYCCRRALLDATNEETALNYLRYPLPNWLPPSADAFITLALSFKVKDDDVRKQRIKMEAQVKRQAQQAPRSTGGAISFPRN
ncbi:RabGAP/TBC [Marasmius fiardii PR-910]|nr:RabGAP/TBC [Marasmius fiardii PR-910]